MAGDAPPTSKHAAVKVFDCPNCGASVTLRTLGQAVSAACGSCGSIIDVANDNLAVLIAAEKKLTLTPLIPLGERGTFHSDPFEIVGFLGRKDGSGEYRWHEYLLFNPYKGFRWLVEAEGHWTLTSTIKTTPTVAGHTAKYLGSSYRLYNRDKAITFFVLGEFYWRVHSGETVDADDFVRPPYILSSERSEGEIIWSHGEYLTPEAVRAAFKLTTLLPTPRGIAPNQPQEASPLPRSYWRRCLGAIALIQLATLLLAPSQELWTEAFAYSSNAAPPTEPAAESDTKVSPTFTIAAANNVEISLEADVSNTWFEIEGALINDQDQTAVPFATGVEYYFGNSGGESWSEGSRDAKILLGDVPAGTYHLSFDPAGAPGQNLAPINYHVKVRRGVIVWSNPVFAMLAVSVLPMFVWFRRQGFDRERWSHSDFSPYGSS